MLGTDGNDLVKAVKNKKPSFEKQNKRALRRSTDDSNAALNETFDDTDENIPDSGRNQDGGGSSFRNKNAIKLMGYLSSWNYREVAGGWKFNKVLQTWAIDNIFDTEKIDVALYESLVPYVITIKGASAERLLAKAEEIIITGSEDVGVTEASNEVTEEEIQSSEVKSKKRKKENDGNSNSDSRLRRAANIKIQFSMLNKTGSS